MKRLIILATCQVCLYLTIFFAFHEPYYRDIKAYCYEHISVGWRSEFPSLMS